MRASGWLSIAALMACGHSASPPEVTGGTGTQPASLMIHVSGPGAVQSASPLFLCHNDCRQDVSGGTVVLAAVPDQTGAFVGWQGDCSGAAACTLSMDADRSVTAVFSTQPPSASRVTVQLTGSGAGRVVSTPSGIDCPGACAMDAAGARVVLHAQPASGSTFHGWGGACSGVADCTLAGGNAVAQFDAASPAAQCAGIAPQAPATPVSASIATPSRCGRGMGDGTGTIGLQAMGSPHGVILHFMDGQTGAQRAVTGNYDGMDGSFMPQPNGFEGAMKSPNIDSWSVHYWNKDGVYVAASNDTMEGGPVAYAPIPGGGIVVAGLRAVTGLPPAQVQYLNRFDMGATRRWSGSMQSLGTVFGVGADVNGAILVISDGGPGTILGQWMDDRGVETSSFVVIDNFTPGSNTWFETAPLIGGGLAVRRVDQQNDASGRPYRTAQWLKVVPENLANSQNAPDWLAKRPNTDLAIARSGRAYALLPMGAPDIDCTQRIEVLAPDGTSCGTFDAAIGAGQCRTEDMALGLDDTPIQLMPAALAAPGTCTYRWWPRAIH
jgi:hypothetical protein